MNNINHTTASINLVPPAENQQEAIEKTKAKISHLRGQGALMGGLIALVAIIAIPIIAFLGILAAMGVFAFAPDALLIPSIAGLGVGGIALLWKLFSKAIDYTKEKVIDPLSEANALSDELDQIPSKPTL